MSATVDKSCLTRTIDCTRNLFCATARYPVPCLLRISTDICRLRIFLSATINSRATATPMQFAFFPRTKCKCSLPPPRDDMRHVPRHYTYSFGSRVPINWQTNVRRKEEECSSEVYPAVNSNVEQRADFFFFSFCSHIDSSWFDWFVRLLLVLLVPADGSACRRRSCDRGDHGRGERVWCRRFDWKAKKHKHRKVTIINLAAACYRGTSQKCHFCSGVYRTSNGLRPCGPVFCPRPPRGTTALLRLQRLALRSERM